VRLSDRLSALRRPRVAIVLGVLLIAAVLLIAGVLLVRDALAAKDALEAAQDQARRAVRVLGEGDVAGASAALDEGRAAIDAARTRVDGPIWALTRRVPLLGRTLELLVRVVDVGDAAITIAGEAVAQGEPFLGDDGSIEVSITDGRVDLTPMRLANRVINELSTGELVAAREALAGSPDTWVPELARAGRRGALGLADLALDTLTTAGHLTSVLPAILGSGGQRTWVVAVQTSAELRATGGLVGYLTELHADDGRLTLRPPIVYDAVDQTDEKTPPAEDALASTLSGGWQDPVDAPPEFEARYGLRGAAGLMSNVNVDPHLPMTGDVLHRLYEKRTGNRIDGVILLDPVAMELLVQATGHGVGIPAAGRTDPQVPETIPADEVAEWATWHVYEVMGMGRSGDRDPFLKAFGISMFEQVLAGGWDGVQMSRHVARAAGRRSLQIYSADPQEQQQLETLGIAGAMQTRAPRSDLLSLVGNNAVGGKMDVHVAHRLAAAIRLGQVRHAEAGPWATREVAARVELENPLPAAGMDTYIIGNCLVDRFGNQCFDGPKGVNRTWFTLWTPRATGFTAGRDADGDPLALGAGVIHGHHATDHFLETQPESSNHFEVDLSGPVELVRDGPDLIYRLTVWRQAKAIPDHLDLTITGPDGWEVAEVTLEGGGDGQGMGVGGSDNQPVRTVGAGGDTVRIRGAATQDVHVEVRYRASLASRLWAWINSPL